MIRASYKRLAKLRHPDKNKGNDESTADFQLVSPDHSQEISKVLKILISHGVRKLHTAYGTLSNLTRRQVYDRRY